MMRSAVAAGVALAVVLAGCGRGSKQSPTPAPTTSTAARPAVTASAGSAAPGGSPLSGNSPSAVEDRLSRAALTQSEVPPGLQLNAKRPYSNHEYATAQPEPGSFEKQLSDGGRISGTLVQWVGPQSVPAGQPVTASLLEALSQWQDTNAAHNGLAFTLRAVAASPQSNADNITTTAADLGQIGDEVSAQHIHAATTASAQPAQDFYIVGLRVGVATVIIIVSGQSGAPTQDAIKQLTTTQAQRLRQAGY
jgi:hypothetical protein